MKIPTHRVQRVLLASVILLASFCIASPVQAATVTGTHGWLKWTSTDGSTASITGCLAPIVGLCDYKVLNIPSTVKDDGGNTYSVTRVNDDALYQTTNMTSLSIPDSVTYLGRRIAFEENPNLATVILGGGILNAADSFPYLTTLTSVKFKGNAPTSWSESFFPSSRPAGFKVYRLAVATGFGSGPTWSFKGKTMDLGEWQLEAPTAPADLAVTLGIRSASISFTDAFNNGSEIARYEYSLDNGVTWTTATQPVGGGPVVVSGLTAKTEYSLKLRAVNNVGSGASSAAVTFVAGDVPDAPVKIGAIWAGGYMGVSVADGDNGGSAITQYEYSIDNGATWVSQVDYLNITSKFFFIKNLGNTVTYSLKVRAVNALGVGASSSSITVRQFSQAITGTHGPLQWRSFDGETATIYRCSTGPYSCTVKVLNIPSTVKDGGGTAYTVTRIEEDALGGEIVKLSIPDSVISLGDYLNGHEMFTTVTVGSGIVFYASAFSFSRSLRTVRLKGNAPTKFKDAINYAPEDLTVYRLAGATGFGGGPTWTTSNGYQSRTVSLADWQLEAPTAPSDLVATTGSGSVSISFSDAYNNGSEISRYEYSLNNGATWITATQSTPMGPIEMSGLTIGTTYSLKLRAVNSLGVGASSDAVTFTATSTPSAPSNLSLVRSRCSDQWPNRDCLFVSFDKADNGKEITKYEYSLDDGATWISRNYLDRLPLELTGIDEIGVDEATNFTVKLRLENANGYGPAASVAALSTTNATKGTTGKLQWMSFDGISASITGCSDSCYTTLNIPSTVKGIDGSTYRVTAVSMNFADYDLKKINFPDSVTLYRGRCFYCSLTEVTFGSGIRKINDWSFFAGGLSTVWFRGNAPEVANPAFANTEITAYRLAGATGFGTGSTWSTNQYNFALQSWTMAAPSAPTNFEITSGLTSLSVSFTDPDNNGSEISRYEYSVDNGVTWATATQPVQMGPIVITGLTSSTNYQLKLRAVSAAGVGTHSDGVATRTKGYPSPPTNVSVTRGDRSLSVSFLTLALNGDTILNNEYSIDDGVTWITPSPSILAGPIVINGLTNGTRYQVRLRAVNDYGAGAGSVAITGRPAIAPSAPTNLVVTPSDAALSVSFTAGASNGEEISNYEYSINDGASWVAASPSVVAGPVVIRGLANGTTYAVKLRAVNDVGSGASSTGVTGRPVAVPSDPTNVVVTRGDKSLSVSFTPAAPNGEVVTNYDYSINDGATWVAVSPSVTSGPIVISGLTNGTRYPVKVRAENAVGKGAASIAVTGRPAIAPAAPTNLVVFRNDASLAIAFTAGADNGEEFTRYEYTIDNGATWKSIRGSDVQSPIRITGLTNGTLYSVSLRAVNDVGPGAISGVVTGTPNAPILSGSAGKNVRIINEPVTTFAANSDIAINGAKVSIGMVPPTVKTNDPITYYQYTLKPTKKGSPVITKLFKAKPGAATSGVLTGKPKTSYTVLVTSVTATGKKKSWVGPPITTG
jgi:titin